MGRPVSGGPAPTAPIGSELPIGVRFVGPEDGARPGWLLPDPPSDEDISKCVACGLCLPQCPTFRLTNDETASPRGRVAAMRAVSEGRTTPDATFARFMDLCLTCRACEDVCPSKVPFGRMMERARVQIEPSRPAGARALKRLGLDVILANRWLLALATGLAPLAKPALPSRVRRLLPPTSYLDLVRPLPRVTEPTGAARGTVALLSGCVQDRWFRSVNRATIRVLARNGWRVVVPKGQTCCGALQAHFGLLGSARALARRNLAAFESADHIVVNAAGCSAHSKEYAQLLDADGDAVALEVARAARFSSKVRDLMEFLYDEGIEPPAVAAFPRVAYHDACHALRAQGIHDQPRAILGSIPGLEIVEIADADVCCGAAGLYNVLEPQMASELGRRKAESLAAAAAPIVASANPGCTMQIAAHLRAQGAAIRVMHPVEILDRSYALSR